MRSLFQIPGERALAITGFREGQEQAIVGVYPHARRSRETRLLSEMRQRPEKQKMGRLLNRDKKQMAAYD